MKYADEVGRFLPWQPSTWPAPPSQWDAEFLPVLTRLFEDTILSELRNIIDDVLKSNGSLIHRGHVIAIGLLCAIDTLGSYGYHDTKAVACTECGHKDGVGSRFKAFIESHFPDTYRPYATDIYGQYRNSLVHSWHLFRVSVTPDDAPITKSAGGNLTVGLLNFFAALSTATSHFLEALNSDSRLQINVLQRYRQLRDSALP